MKLINTKIKKEQIIKIIIFITSILLILSSLAPILFYFK